MIENLRRVDFDNTKSMTEQLWYDQLREDDDGAYCMLDDEVAEITEGEVGRKDYLKNRVLTPEAKKAQNGVISAKGSLEHRKMQESAKNRWAAHESIIRHLPKTASQMSRPFNSQSRVTYGPLSATSNNPSRRSSPEMGIFVTRPKVQRKAADMVRRPKTTSKIGVRLLRES